MLHLNTIEKHTLELLNKIQSLPAFSDCRLVGGTALALQLGHRKSIDLDFFGQFDLSAEEIKVELSKLGTLKIIQETKFIFQYILNDIKIDFVNYPYDWIAPMIIENGIILADKKDIAAMKLSAITNRGTKKDFVDIFELLKIFTLEELLKFFTLKYKDNVPFMTIKSLTYFEDAEEEPMPYMFSNTSWDEIKNKITQEVIELAK